MHDNEQLPNIEKMNSLLSYLGGSIYNAIFDFVLSDKNYVEAIDVSKQQFGSKTLIIVSHINTLLILRPVLK